MKRLHIVVIAALLCHSVTLFSQRTFNIIEQVNDNNDKPVFISIQKNNKKAIDIVTEKSFLRELYAANKDIEYTIVNENREDGFIARCYQQYYKGLKVIGGSSVVNSKDGDVEYVSGNYAELDININTDISDQQLYDYTILAVQNLNDIKNKFGKRISNST